MRAVPSNRTELRYLCKIFPQVLALVIISNISLFIRHRAHTIRIVLLLKMNLSMLL